MSPALDGISVIKHFEVRDGILTRLLITINKSRKHALHKFLHNCLLSYSVPVRNLVSQT